MEIQRIGLKSILIKGKKESVVVNVGIEKIIKIAPKCRIVIYTEEGVEQAGKPGGGEMVVVYGPGEYEVGGVRIRGWDIKNKRTFYTIEMDGVTIGILDELGEAMPEKRIELVGSMDCLIFSLIQPVVERKTILGWSKRWGVNFLVPMSGSESEIAKFLDEMDREGLKPSESLKIDPDNLPEGTDVVMLETSE